jgi:TPR repeat protein
VPSQTPAERPPAGGPARLPDAPTSAGLDSQSVAVAPEASTATAAGTLADRFADAERAMAAKRYTDAVAIVRPLADAGDARAQVMLGDLYADGRGIARDERAAASWYEKAALQGETGAQLKLAVMYAKGIGVNRNNNLAYVWYGTAARLGSHPAKLEQERIAALLQPMEREQADQLIESSVAHMARKP